MQKYRKRADSPHVRIYRAMIQSQVYDAISGNALKLYIKLLDEWGGREENQIKLPYVQTGLSFDGASYAFAELEAFGFIDIIERGGLFKSSNIYALSDRWKQLKKDDLLKIKDTLRAHRKK